MKGEIDKRCHLLWLNMLTTDEMFPTRHPVRICDDKGADSASRHGMQSPVMAERAYAINAEHRTLMK